MIPTITVIDNFLSVPECKHLIKVFYQLVIQTASKPKDEPWRQLEDSIYMRYPPGDNEFNSWPSSDHFISKMNKKLSKAMNNEYVVEWCNLARWDVDTYQPLHLDGASPRTCMTTVFYLNEGFEGGRTYFEDGTTVAPKTGRVLVFNGDESVHGVAKITKGTRYSLSAWWMKNYDGLDD